MAKVYRDIYILVGMETFTSKFVRTPMDVMTENSIGRVLASFPTSYADYTKIIDLEYMNSDGNIVVSSYDMSYDDTLARYYFIIDRTFTYGEYIKLQFRARYSDLQEAVDEQIFTIYLRDAIKKENIDVLSQQVYTDVSVLLQGLVDEHAALLASTVDAGHVKVDGITLEVTEGVISTKPRIYVQSTEPTSPSVGDIWINTG